MSETTRIPFALKGFAIVALSFLSNELLMGIIPHIWDVPYFPIRTVGVGLIGIAVLIRLFVRLTQRPSLRRAVDVVITAPPVIAVVWFNYAYRGMLFFDRWQR